VYASKSRDFYALVDCNCFYVSCERGFNPAREGRPVVVLSNNDGCVIALSPEAKALDILMGDPAFERKSFFAKHGVRAFSSNYALYGDMSARVMQVLSRFSPDMERYSIDESFLLFREADMGKLPGLAREIRDTVRKWTGIPVCVGLARTKTLSKIANRLAKKTPGSDGTWILDDQADIEAQLAKIDVADIWGIGRCYARFLHSRGIDTALDLERMPRPWVRKHLTVNGLQTALELGQTPCLSLERSPAEAKTLICSRSFGKRISDLGHLEEALASYVQRALERLRAQKLLAGAVYVHLETNRFMPDPQHFPGGGKALAYPSSYTADILAAALEVLRGIHRPGYLYQKAGVMLLDLVAEDRRQLSFFEPDPERQARNKTLMRAMDRVNGLYGRDTLKMASAGTGKRPWHMRQHLLSRRYTTSWCELPVVR